MHLGHTLESTSDTAQTPVRGWGRPSSSVCLIPASAPLGPRSPESPTVPQRGHATSHRWASTGKSLCLECSPGYPVGSLSLPSSPGQLLKEVFPVHPLIRPSSQPTSLACAWNVLDAQNYVSKCTHMCVFIEELGHLESFIFISNCLQAVLPKSLGAVSSPDIPVAAGWSLLAGPGVCAASA